MNRSKGALLLAGLVLTVIGLAGAVTSVWADGSAVGATLSDFKIAASPSSVGAGEVTFNVNNASAAETHEFVVVRTDVAQDAFPKSADDPNKVDEEAVGEVIGEVEDVLPGTSATLTLDLDAGKYVLICNLPGHYQLGMHVAFTVTEVEEPAATATPQPEATGAPEAQATEAPQMAPPASGSGGLLDRDSGNDVVFALIVGGVGLTLIGVTALRSRSGA